MLWLMPFASATNTTPSGTDRITRLKQHLANDYFNTTSCNKCPQELR